MTIYNDGNPTCPICGAKTNQNLCELDGFIIWRCSQSATDFVWPMPNQKVLKRLYDDENWFEGGQPGGYKSYDVQTEELLLPFRDILAECERDSEGRSILDVGCAYGSHLAVAYERGWKCFGVEPSEHARKVATERHGNKLFIVDSIERLIPHEFNLILMFDVLEHLRDPYELFFSLFSIGAIGPKTKIIITTPNARSNDAVINPKLWAYRHPPSHLIYYSGESLNYLLTKLRFNNIQISGMHPLAAQEPVTLEVEGFDTNDALSGYAGLLCEAWGSDFMSFMHERYVPGTWSRIAAYEHLPRYHFAKKFAHGADVLDFGCGTGYGAAIMAGSANSVTGVDISADALRWAKQTHQIPGLQFENRDDLGSGIPDQSFNLITCFEMIEHVDAGTQIEVISNFARLLTPEGKLIISTPNPQVTANYGDNPFHLREMTETEFTELLKTHFKHVVILRQWIGTSVLISAQVSGQTNANAVIECDDNGTALPLAYIAVCSHDPVPRIPVATCSLDLSYDYIAETLSSINELNMLKLEKYTSFEQAVELQKVKFVEHTLSEQVAELYKIIAKQASVLAEQETIINSVFSAKLWRITKPLRWLGRIFR